MLWKKPSEDLSKFLDDIFIRLSEQDRHELVSKYDEAGKFEPIKGRIMKEYLVLPEILYNDPKKFQEWLNRSFQYASSLTSRKQNRRSKTEFFCTNILMYSLKRPKSLCLIMYLREQSGLEVKYGI